MPQVPPLEPGTVVGARYEVSGLLGRGGFSIAYSATDLQRGDAAVLKELAPVGSTRDSTGFVDLSGLQSVQPARLKERFLDEARLMERLRLPGVPAIRDELEDNGTAYFVSEFIPGAVSLQKVLGQEGRMDSDAAMDILLQLLDTLEAIHARGILHRDIKPSNVLLEPEGKTYLIDFGAAREWHADQAIAHTVMYTPGYAPIEQLSERGRRGPATDIYALCATAYHMLAGFAPRSATERAAGTEMTDLATIRTDLDKPVLNAIKAGLQMQFSARPQSVGEFRELLSYEDQEVAAELNSIEGYDRIAVRMQGFGFKKRECPACGDLLETPKPLKKGQCPVCREGTLERRDLSEKLCPNCKTGVLHLVKNSGPLSVCPVCRMGRLESQKQGMIRAKHRSACPECAAVLLHERDGAILEVAGKGHLNVGLACSWEEWRKLSGRTPEVYFCDGCEAQYDLMQNGKRRQIRPAPKEFEELYPDEWARVARGLSPDAGNVQCDRCNADFQVDQDFVTLLSARTDPFRFGKKHLGENVRSSELAWVAVGKSSAHPGLLCGKCGTEFDSEGGAYRLVKTGSKRLLERSEFLLSPEDWHRAAHGLPLTSEQDEFEDAFTAEIEQAFVRGDLPFESRSDVLWRSGAVLVDEGERSSGQLVVDESEIRFERLLRKRRWPLAALRHYVVREKVLELRFENEVVMLEVEPVEMEVELESGTRGLLLTAEQLGKVLGRCRKAAYALMSDA